MNVVGIAGGTVQERRAFIDAAKPELEAFPGLSLDQRDFEDMSVAWAVSPHTPFSEFSYPGGPFCLCFGVLAEKPPLMEASQFVLDQQKKETPAAISGLNGFYYAITRSADGAVSIGADFLGNLPIFYYSNARYFVFSTTPAVFKYLPGFSAELDPEGLAALLLTNVLATGATLLKGVRHALGAHAVIWNKGEAATERRGYMLRPGNEHFGKTFRQQMDLVHAILERVVQREKKRVHSPAMLLTGGLDSRLLCGFLQEAYGRNVFALTQGWKNDFEMCSARQLSRELGWQHESHEPDFSCFDWYAMLKLQHEHLAYGFNTPCFMQMVSKLQKSGPIHFSGVHGTASTGAASLLSIERFDPKFSFEACNRSFNLRGFEESAIRKLVPAAILKDGIERALAALRQIYDRCEGLPYQKAWLYDLLGIDRLRVGFIPRMLTFGSWPSVPYADRDLLEAIAQLPYESIRSRRLETEMVCTYFPRLAALPLDRNSFDLSPVFGLKRLLRGWQSNSKLAPLILSRHVQAKIMKPIETFGAKLTGREKRFYYRTFDLNNEGWKTVKKISDGCRDSLSTFLVSSAVDSYLPAVGVVSQTKDGITAANKAKILMGLSIWASNNFQKKGRIKRAADPITPHPTETI